MNKIRPLLQVLLPVVILALGAGAAFALISMREEPVERAPEIERPIVETVAANRAEVPIRIASRGTVRPRAQTRLMAEVSGRVTSISPSLVNGGFIREGEELLKIDDTDYRLALSEAQLSLAQAELKLEQTRADAELARTEWMRLGREGQPSALTLREPQLAEAEATLASGRARVDRALRDIERCTVTAPYDGRIRSEQVDVGQLLMPGVEIASIYAIDTAEVRLLLPDDELEFLDLPLGAPLSGGDASEGSARPQVTLSTEFAGVQHAWEGEIVRTEGELDPMTRMVVAVAEVTDPFGRGPGARAGRPPLAPGMFVDAQIEGRTVNGVPIPRGSLRGGNRVLTVVDGALQEVDVVVLHTDRERAVLASGLGESTRVVVSPVAAAYDGMPVEERAQDAAEEE